MSKNNIPELLQVAIQAHTAGDNSVAEKYYMMILDKQSDHPDACHNLGILLAKTNTERALLLLKTALEKKPNHGQFWVSYIEVLILAKQKAEAINTLSKGMQIGLKGERVDQLAQQLGVDESSGSEPGVDDVLHLYNGNNFDGVLEKGISLLERDPNNEILLNVLGATYQKLGRLDSAVEHYTKALTINPRNYDIKNNLGLALKDLGRLEEAALYLDEVLRDNPNYADAYINLGLIYLNSNKFREAVPLYEKYLEIVPDAYGVRINLGLSLNEIGRTKEALEQFDMVLKESPISHEAYYNKGGALLKCDEFDAAADTLKSAILLAPDLFLAYYNLAKSLSNQQKVKAEATTLKYATKLVQNYPDLWNNLALNQEKQRDRYGCIYSFKKALILDPTDPKPASNLSGVFFRLQNSGESLKQILRALSIDPMNQLFQDQYVYSASQAAIGEGNLHKATLVRSKLGVITFDLDNGITLSDGGRK
ncbi:MAG: hypothetical protein CMF67_12010 [Magnetovibrio sp.]|nr:hypothetical protein [Magnetovibrio sp.]|tara:strand:+ start:19660 stop:21099 length:1440 start_codon:yes stop_codon:yes gene_type:complete